MSRYRYLSRVAHAVAWAFLLGGCARLPVEPPALPAVGVPAPTPTPARSGTLADAALDTPTPTPTPAEALAPVPPSLLSLITPATPPQVAAAIRLVESARAQADAADREGARETLERAIAIDPNNAYAYYFLAELHFARHAYDQALAFAGRAAALGTAGDASWPSRAYALEGRVYEAAGRFADARAAYQRAVRAEPRNRAAAEALARLGGTPVTP
jgi:hypothetical protein